MEMNLMEKNVSIMAYRFTNTEKWRDAWFIDLSANEKLLFMYLCDNCDIAGFIEYNPKLWAFETGTDKKTIEGALKGLTRGLILSKDKTAIYIRNFLKHQKNIELNPDNNAHKGILKRFQLYALKFDIQDVNKFILGASEGLGSPIGKGNGNGNGNLIVNKEEIFEKKEPEYLTISKEIFIEWYNKNDQSDQYKCKGLMERYKHVAGISYYYDKKEVGQLAALLKKFKANDRKQSFRRVLNFMIEDEYFRNKITFAQINSFFNNISEAMKNETR